MTKKYYIGTSLNGQEFALITDQEPKQKYYQEITEVSKDECEEKAKEKELIKSYNGNTRRYLYNTTRGEFDCIYNSTGTGMGANDWGFVR